MEYSIIAEKPAAHPSCATATNTADAVDHAVEVPVTDNVVIAAEESQTCGHVDLLGVLGWLTLMVNLVNVGVTLKLCYDLAEYLNAPHPDNDAYALAGLAYLFYLPSLLDSVLIILFVGFVLYHQYTNTAGCRVCSTCVRVWCYAIVCTVLFLISCWPTGVIVSIIFQQGVFDFSTFQFTGAFAIGVVWVSVTLTFCLFSLALCLRTGVPQRDS